MKSADWYRAAEKAETWSEWLLMQIIGLPKPFTGIVTIVMLFFAGVGVGTVASKVLM